MPLSKENFNWTILLGAGGNVLTPGGDEGGKVKGDFLWLQKGRALKKKPEQDETTAKLSRGATTKKSGGKKEKNVTDGSSKYLSVRRERKTPANILERTGKKRSEKKNAPGQIVPGNESSKRTCLLAKGEAKG